MLLQQSVGFPVHMAQSPSSLLLCPGFPPTPLLHLFKRRVIPYIHDVFLLSRRDDINWRAKAYSAWPFGLAVRRLRRFLVNSVTTATRLAQYCLDNADITIYRPQIQNSFALSSAGRESRATRPAQLQLVALGTVEPRKNFLAAAAIVAALRQRNTEDVTLEVIGRRGWGDDWKKLEADTRCHFARLSARPGRNRNSRRCRCSNLYLA